MTYCINCSYLCFPHATHSSFRFEQKTPVRVFPYSIYYKFYDLGYFQYIIWSFAENMCFVHMCIVLFYGYGPMIHLKRLK